MISDLQKVAYISIILLICFDGLGISTEELYAKKVVKICVPTQEKASELALLVQKFQVLK